MLGAFISFKYAMSATVHVSKNLSDLYARYVAILHP